MTFFVRVTIDTSKKRISQKHAFMKDVTENEFKKPFSKLTMRQRRLRMAKIGKIVLGACVEKGEFRKSDTYIEKDMSINDEIVLRSTAGQRVASLYNQAVI